MPSYTGNIKLKKPYKTEKFTISDQNGNMDILDKEITANKLRNENVEKNMQKLDGKFDDFENKINETGQSLNDIIAVADEKIEEIKELDPSSVVQDVARLRKEVLDNTFTKIETDSHLTALEGSKDGYISNMKIKGKTLQNVCGCIGRILSNTMGKTVELNNNLLKLNTPYTFILDLGNVKGGNKSIFLKWTKSDGGFEYRTWDLQESKNKVTPKVVTFSEEPKNLVLEMHAENSSDTVINVNSLLTLEGDKIEELPQYFEGIKSSGESEGNKISILTKSKNLFDKDNLEQGTSIAVLGKTWSDSKIEATTRVRTSHLITVKPNTKYQLTQNSNFLFVVKEFDENGIGIKDVGWDTHRTFTTLPNTRYLALMIRKQDDSNITPLEIQDKNIQLEEGTTSTQYVSGKTDKTEILCGNEPLRGLPNGIGDIIDFDNNEITRKIGKIIANGSEDWQNSAIVSEKYFIAYLRKDESKPYSKLLCDKFRFSDTLNADTNDRVVSFDNNSFKISILKTELETPDISGLKKWIKANNITFYYELAEPKTERIAYNNVLACFENGYIQLENSITPNIYIEYNTNIPSQITSIANSLNLISTRLSMLEELQIESIVENVKRGAK